MPRHADIALPPPLRGRALPILHAPRDATIGVAQASRLMRLTHRRPAHPAPEAAPRSAARAVGTWPTVALDPGPAPWPAGAKP